MRDLAMCELEMVQGGGKGKGGGGKGGLGGAVLNLAAKAAEVIKDMVDNAEEGQVDMANGNNLANVYGA